jgi:hypothetical protein
MPVTPENLERVPSDQLRALRRQRPLEHGQGSRSRSLFAPPLVPGTHRARTSIAEILVRVRALVAVRPLNGELSIARVELDLRRDGRHSKLTAVGVQLSANSQRMSVVRGQLSVALAAQTTDN